ncbi:22870_t:CDS:2 [Cetraspora pellucida]|uniref:22870_t:CDS:1 n=1 Tax=Cetraspora pellucida TaxID=1433469 RepID=A0A9N9FJ42_9GLOM|nr:22870_t:CDS:2 [Cetraspora pellucida]
MDEIVTEINEHLKEFDYEDFQDIQYLSNISNELSDISRAYSKTNECQVIFNNEQDIDELKSSLVNGKRESPINLTPVDYKELYYDAWDMDHNKRPSIKDVIRCLKDIELDLVYHVYPDSNYVPKISYKRNSFVTKKEACFKIIEGSPKNQYLFIPEGEILLGRKDSNYIVIKDSKIDKNHAKIKNYQGKVDIIGIGSKSEIFVNGKQLEFRTLYNLKKNDLIKIGSSTFQYLPIGEFKNSIDPFLQIYNTNYLWKSLETGFKNSQNSRLSLLFCDLDHFGKINKNYGYEAGDYILIELSKFIQNKYIRDKDIFSRYSGEEFTILLINTNIKLAYNIAKEIRSSIETYPFIFKGKRLPSITLSIGVSEVNSSVKKSEDLLNHAEEACRKAKEYGRNRVIIWENEQISIPQMILQSKFQPTIPTQIPPFPPFPPSENEVLKIDKKWHLILGEEMPLIEPQHYFILCKIIPQPKLLSHEIYVNVATVLPYIRQKVKMWGVDIFKAENFANLVNEEEDEESSDDETKDENKKLIRKNRLSRFDCIATLFASAESTVVQDIIKTMSQFPIAFPLLMPTLDNAEKFKVMLPLYTGLAIKWNLSNGSVIENHLFEDSFKMIVAVRIGMNPQGKSTILNQLMASKYMFTSSSEPRADYGIPHMINGSVEFVWLTEETCGPDLWNSVFKRYYEEERKKIVLLANLHGDALDYPDQIEFLKQLPSCFLVFLMPGYNEGQKVRLRNLIGSKKVIYNYVNSENNVANYTIDTNSLMSNETIKDACKMFKDILYPDPVDLVNLDKFSISTLEIGDTLQFSEKIECVESQEIINLIKEKTCRHTRLEIMQLQKKQGGSDCIQFWEQTPELQELMQLFSSIIILPIRIRRRALAHLEKEIFKLSTSESSKLRNNAISKRKELNNANITNNVQEKIKIREEITKLWKEVDNTSLGIEHFIRELEQMYKIFISDPKKITSDNGLTKENISKLPEYYAELLISGHTIELIDGDSSTISEAWFLAVCNCIDKKIPNLKIFVISILGLQSSGKSTLLNTLFASKFAVSTGRCTKGLLMQFLFLEKELSNQLDVDAFILIDTEGLGAPEKMGDLESEKKDRMLATFVMRISNLTIINIVEESTREILQIVTGIIMNLDISPDILMVQHVTKKNSIKFIDIERKFYETLQGVLEITRKEDNKARAYNFERLSRLKDKKLLKLFSSFKDDITAHSSPSKQYHKDIVDFYNSIIDNCKTSQSKKKFSDWFPLIKSYWDVVSNENSSFEEIKETYDFIEFGNQIANLKGIIDMAFLKHKELIENNIRFIVYKWVSNKDSSVNSINLKCGKLIKKLNNIPELKNLVDCEECKKVNKEKDKLDKYLEKKNDKKFKEEANQTITNYIISRREFISTKLENMLEGILIRNRFSIFIDRILEEILSTWKKLPDEKKFEEEANKIWKQLRDRVSIENEDFINEEIDDIINEEYETMWTSDFFENYKLRIIPELSKIDAIYNVSSSKFFKDKCMEQDNITRLKKEINLVVGQILRNIKRFNPKIVRDLKGKIEKKLKDLSTKLNVKFNPNFEMNVHVYTLLNFREEMVKIQEIWDKDNAPLSVLDQRKDEYIEMIKLRLQYGHSHMYKGHLTGAYLLRAIHKKAVNAENRDRREHAFRIPWIKNSETIRLEYFIELAEQVHNGDKDKAIQHFLKPQESIEEWFKNNVNKYTRKGKGRKYEKTLNTEFDYVRQEIRNCKSYEDIKKFVNVYMTQVDGINYQLNIKDSSIAENFDLFHEAILKELDSRGNGHCQLEEKSLPNIYDDELIKNRLGCTKSCYWCGALCWGERGHDNDIGETKIHHSSHQPAGLRGTHDIETNLLLSEACHNSPDDSYMQYYIKEVLTTKIWSEAKSTDFKDWKFGPHYMTDFNEIMCWFFEMLHIDLAEKKDLLPADEWDLEEHEGKLTSLNLSSGFHSKHQSCPSNI